MRAPSNTPTYTQALIMVLVRVLIPESLNSYRHTVMMTLHRSSLLQRSAENDGAEHDGCLHVDVQ